MAKKPTQDTDITMVRGDTLLQTFNIQKNSAAYDLTGNTVRAMGRASEDNNLTLFDVTIADAAPSDFSTGKVVLSVPPATTATFPETVLYDIQSDDGAGLVETLVKGHLFVQKDITRT